MTLFFFPSLVVPFFQRFFKEKFFWFQYFLFLFNSFFSCFFCVLFRFLAFFSYPGVKGPFFQRFFKEKFFWSQYFLCLLNSCFFVCFSSVFCSQKTITFKRKKTLWKRLKKHQKTLFKRAFKHCFFLVFVLSGRPNRVNRICKFIFFTLNVIIDTWIVHHLKENLFPIRKNIYLKIKNFRFSRKSDSNWLWGKKVKTMQFCECIF